MRIISHRGNLSGKILSKENTEEYLLAALNEGFDIEFDIWYMAGKFWLGHDQPDRSYSIDHLIQWSNRYANQKFYVHCKNLWSMEKLSKFRKQNVIPFFHDVDQCILLTDNTIWVHPNSIHSTSERKNCIAVYSTCKSIEYDIELDLDYKNFYGICTDYPIDVRNSIQ